MKLIHLIALTSLCIRYTKLSQVNYQAFSEVTLGKNGPAEQYSCPKTIKQVVRFRVPHFHSLTPET